VNQEILNEIFPNKKRRTEVVLIRDRNFSHGSVLEYLTWVDRRGETKRRNDRPKQTTVSMAARNNAANCEKQRSCHLSIV